MSPPLRLLSGLCVLATAIGALCWREHEWRLRAAAHPAAPATPAPAASGSADVNAVSALETQVNDYKARVTALQAENAALQEQLDRAREAAKPPPSPDSVATQLAELRELSFRATPEWVPAGADEILAQIRAGIESGLTPESSRARSRAAVALGLHAGEFDYREGLISLEQMQAGGCYDADANRFSYQKEASLSRADGRELFAGALLPVLLAQNFPLAARSRLDTPNDDEARAADALARGDANFTRVRFSIGDRMDLNFDQSGAPVVPPPTYDAPVFLAEAWKFTHDRGSLFVESLQAAGGQAAVNQAYSRPPRSTAEILHPEELYLANPPFVPVEVALPETPVAGVPPLHSNVAGELSIYTALRAHCDADYSADAAAGWHGDRYLLYPGSGESGDHLFWKSVWLTPGDAEQFFQAMRRILMQRYFIPWQERYDVAPGRFEVTDPHRVIRLARHDDGLTVTLLDAADPAFAAALERAAAGW